MKPFFVGSFLLSFRFVSISLSKRRYFKQRQIARSASWTAKEKNSEICWKKQFAGRFRCSNNSHLILHSIDCLHSPPYVIMWPSIKENNSIFWRCVQLAKPSDFTNCETLYTHYTRYTHYTCYTRYTRCTHYTHYTHYAPYTVINLCFAH
jgi:hypothetical protein